MTASTRQGWEYLGEEPYWFDHWGRGTGRSFRQVAYDHGVWIHPRGEEPTMENIDEFAPDYPPGWYWSGSGSDGAVVGDGPYPSREAAMIAAEAAP